MGAVPGRGATPLTPFFDRAGIRGQHARADSSWLNVTDSSGVAS